MKIGWIVGTLLVAAAAPASAMDVATFLAKANGLKNKGPMALFSGDTKLLMNQAKSDSAQLRAENAALAAAGKPKAYCAPEGGVNLNQDGIMAAMNAVEPAKRATTTTTAALRNYLAGRYPCRR